MVARHHGGMDLGLRGSLDTDHSDRGVIAVNQLQWLLGDYGKHQELYSI